VNPDIQTGFGRRGYTWEFDGSVQHELLPRMSVGFAYYRRLLGGNATSTQNLNQGPSAYQGPYCITGPRDPRLPDGGGQRYCGIYQRTAASYNVAADSYQTFLTDYLDQLGVSRKNYRHGFDITTRARIRNGGVLQGGVSISKGVSDTCYTQLLGNPTNIISPFTGDSPCAVPAGSRVFQPDLKLLTSYNLRFGIVASGTFQYTPGPQRGATWTYTQAIANANGFSISAAPGSTAAQIASTTASFDLLGGTTIYEPGLKQLDLRGARAFKIGKDRLQVMADVYNVFNSNWVFSQNGTFGTGAAAAATWLRPTNVLSARMFKIGAQFNF
jgi:hypothetical protein